MALVNYTLPFGNIQAPTWATASPLQNQHASAVNNLLYGPAGHQGDDQDYYKNAPYAPPQRQAKQSPQQQQQQQQHSIQYRQTPRNNYLPPPSFVPPGANYSPGPTPPPQTQQSPPAPGRTYGEGSYADGSPTNGGSPAQQQQPAQQPPPAQQPAYYEYSSGSYATQPGRPFAEQHANPQTGTNYRSSTPQQAAAPAPPAVPRAPANVQGGTGSYVQRPAVFASVGPAGTRTSIHPVLDYDEEDDDDYYDEAVEVTPIVGISDNRKNSRMPTVTPIQGPIFIKNGTVPVVPLFAYPQVSNGTFIQIPIWWTALSVALGLSIHGDVIRGVPCIKKYHQLFCPTAGNTYPSDKIEMFIDENKALMKRMYGDFEMASRLPSAGPGRKRKRSTPGDPYDDGDDFTLLPELMDLYGEPGGEVRIGGDSYFSKLRKKRQNTSSRGSNSGGRGGSSSSGGSGTNARQTATPANGNGGGTGESNTGRVDACESKIEIVTPYWATNSAGKVRAIVNTQHFEQAIHQEVCSSKTQTNRCSGDCGCEQKYKWHRLLAYDPDNDCKGIFMDWFLFPSCCVCRCNP
ncbi:protein spaetzle 3 isoform X1 [Anopheles arabiensis]|uniref:protein spaetzle 3 isoform X1 n=1 Tax=Anopheles arabiensis TaxID=7173 RepID=UPI001AAD7467|nr:protein spaetzle 3 isoform X1 [Anopheles arabiensis]XP_040163038.1 protein spaetzle 3 isoform X1 [Anopheles arabiensis]XP_040163039.1 protein spaetzle 3 isoform X1 [Anopheles arabiensis]XP_061514083.1 protein spaetzle 3 isoform X1 [Anopheles gambiae]XP_061514084.1 protein spaetzle 3 isoform X1 [Anopheles gambiae]